MFENEADIDTAYAEQVTVRDFFSVPYNQEIPMKDGSKETVVLADDLAGAQASALEEAKLVAADMKDKSIQDAVASGKIPEIVAIIAYMNSLK